LKRESREKSYHPSAAIALKFGRRRGTNLMDFRS
jgi:hypothetical protein